MGSFDDFLFLKSLIINRKHYYKLCAPSYKLINKEWYEWSKQKGLILRHLGELKKAVGYLINVIQKFGEKHGYIWKNNVLERQIFNNLTYPLYLLLVGKEIKNPRQIEHFAPIYEKEELIPFIEKNLAYIIKSIKGRSLSATDKDLVREIIEKILGKAPKNIIAPYPSNNFVISFVDKIFHSNLLNKYNEYSHFVHSYFTSWYIFPFSSILEFKIFKHEFQAFSEKIKDLLNIYIKTFFTLDK